MAFSMGKTRSRCKDFRVLEIYLFCLILFKEIRESAEGFVKPQSTLSLVSLKFGGLHHRSGSLKGLLGLCEALKRIIPGFFEIWPYPVLVIGRKGTRPTWQRYTPVLVTYNCTAMPMLRVPALNSYTASGL